MKFRIAIATLLAASWFASAPGRCHGEELEFPDATLTHEQWRERLEQARRRSEEFVRDARASRGTAQEFNLRDAEASERAMNDHTLRDGDIISTETGLLVFTGKDEAHSPHDFRSAPSSARRP